MRREIFLHNAGELNPQRWRELQGLTRLALQATLKRTPDEVDNLIGWRESQRYFSSHARPNTEVGHGFNPNQAFYRPRVAIAIENNVPVGWAYAANNVSGETAWQRMAKRGLIGKNYLWLREIAVRPDRQHQGIAGELGHALLRSARPNQPVSTYIWPDELPDLQPTLSGLGFQPTGEQLVVRFGPDSEPIREVHMQAQTVKDVLDHLQSAA